VAQMVVKKVGKWVEVLKVEQKVVKRVDEWVV
jgi:hypothetical protein